MDVVVVDVVICEFKTMELYRYVKKAMVKGKKNIHSIHLKTYLK